MRGEIVLFDEQHGEPAPRGIACDSRAVDAAADDEQIVSCPFPQFCHSLTSFPDLGMAASACIGKRSELAMFVFENLSNIFEKVKRMTRAPRFRAAQAVSARGYARRYYDEKCEEVDDARIRMVRCGGGGCARDRMRGRGGIRRAAALGAAGAMRRAG
jgi:hypothetical protein